MSKLRIAILGSRGIPGNYGGFETCAEELASRLVQEGHSVTVYCCKPYSKNPERFFKGIRRVILPTIKKKSLEKLVFTLLSLIYVSFTKTDVVLMLGVSASSFCFIPRLFGIKVVINVDGLEWRRKKWGPIASTYLRFSERMACRTTNRVVTDARCVQDFYLKTYRKETTFIPYGARPVIIPPNGVLSSLGLSPKGYVLYVSRFEPENNPLLVRRAFERVKSEKKLVMLGSAPYAKEYVRQVLESQDKRILFPGAIYGDGYLELQSNTDLYIQATSVGGIHPALVEAIGFGHCIIANDVPEHREILEDAGIYYNGTEEDLAEKLQNALDDPEFAAECRDRVRRQSHRYSWDAITKDYIKIFEECLVKKF